MLWKTEGKMIKEVGSKPLSQQGKKEELVEEWIKRNPSFLHEDLVIFSQQYKFPSGEKADLIGIDENGSLVTIEIKRGKTGKKVDIQSLKYASYVSNWNYDDIEKIAKHFFEENPDLLEEKFHSLTTLLQERFGEEFSVENLNRRQRIVIVAQRIEARIGSVLVWLYNQNVDIKAVEFEPYEINGTTYLYSKVVIPIKPYKKYVEIRRPSETERPWIKDSEGWHRNERMSKETNDLFDRLDEKIQSLFLGIDGPNWSQEFYISYKIAGINWLTINTHKTLLNCNFHYKPGDFTRTELAKRLSIDEQDIEISERKERNRARIKITPDYDINTPEFENFLKECHQSFEKIYL